MRGPTLAIVGEAGPEAVVPLANARGSVDPLPLRGFGGAGVNIVINATGSDAASQWASISPMITKEVKSLFGRLAREA